MSDEDQKTLKKGAQVLLAGGGVVYGVLVPAYFFEIFEQKQVAQAAYQRLERDQDRHRAELREDLVRALESIEKKLDRLDSKVDRMRR
jgi:hypothetical protein